MDPQTIEKAIKRCIDISTRLGALEDELPPAPGRVIVQCVDDIDEMQRWLEGREQSCPRLARRPLRPPSRTRSLAAVTSTPAADRAGRKAAPRPPRPQLPDLPGQQWPEPRFRP